MSKLHRDTTGQCDTLETQTALLGNPGVSWTSTVPEKKVFSKDDAENHRKSQTQTTNSQNISMLHYFFNQNSIFDS